MKRASVLALLLLFTVSVHAQWQRVVAGVEYQHVVRAEWDVHVARIDLREKSLRVIASEAGDRGLTVSEFGKKRKAILAINADYFNEQQWPIGLAAGACGTWTKGVKVGRKQGLVGVGKRRAEIQRNTMIRRRWMSGAVSGWPMLNQNCEPLKDLPGSDFFTRAPHPRTAVGLSKDGKTMYFVVADGRKPGVPGPTLPELAQFMDEIGACSAMNLDGGGSSAFWLRDAVVNRPSDGFERNVGNHLAVIAAGDYKGCSK